MRFFTFYKSNIQHIECVFLKPQIQNKKEYNSVTPVFLLSDTLPPLQANEKQIRQMIVNLILNALDAMPAGSGGSAGARPAAHRVSHTAHRWPVALPASRRAL